MNNDNNIDILNNNPRPVQRDAASAGNVLDLLASLKKVLRDSYSALKANAVPSQNIKICDENRLTLNHLVDKIKDMDLNGPLPLGIDIEQFKNKLRDEIREIASINKAFSDLIRKNIYYNHLTMSFISDELKKNNIYNNSGENNSEFSYLKNVLIGSGIKA